ncbi:MAG: hypothetical protein WC758_04350 [Candidatus Woesearchaeota archaeon]|jgi:hypothetical protein
MNSKEIKQKIDEGYIHINVIYEIVGNPKEYVAKALGLVLDKIKAQKEIIFLTEESGEVEDAGDGLWGTYAEVEMLVKDIKTLSWLSFNFIPASLEIKAPAKLMIKDKEMTDFMSDLISQLHEANKKSVQTNSMNIAMLKNINGLMRNAVLISLNQKEKTAAELSKQIGIQTKDIDPLLEAMIKENTIEKKGTKYFSKIKK